MTPRCIDSPSQTATLAAAELSQVEDAAALRRRAVVILIGVGRSALILGRYKVHVMHVAEVANELLANVLTIFDLALLTVEPNGVTMSGALGRGFLLIRLTVLVERNGSHPAMDQVAVQQVDARQGPNTSPSGE